MIKSFFRRFGGSTGDDQTIIVDLDGAVKAIKASEQIDHQHFIMVSTYDSRRKRLMRQAT